MQEIRLNDIYPTRDISIFYKRNLLPAAIPQNFILPKISISQHKPMDSNSCTLLCSDPSDGILVVLQTLHKKMLACFTKSECTSKLYRVLDRNLFSDPFKGYKVGFAYMNIYK